jgi:hypothetical protein
MPPTEPTTTTAFSSTDPPAANTQLSAQLIIRDSEPGEQEAGADTGLRWQPASQRALSASLARTAVWRNVLTESMKVLGSEGGWDAIAAWLPEDAGALGCAAVWTAHPELGRFEALSREASEKAADSLLAQAFHAPHLSWLTQIDAVDDERLKVAAAHGMRSALLLPIRDGATSIGLLELLTHAGVEPDAQIAISLEAAALQLGHFGHLLRLASRPAAGTGLGPEANGA